MKASFLLSGLDINSPFKSITLSAPKTNLSRSFKLILLALSSAKFFEIISGLAFSLIRLVLTGSSSTFEGLTSFGILFLSKISFLTLLLDARITFAKAQRDYVVSQFELAKQTGSLSIQSIK